MPDSHELTFSILVPSYNPGPYLSPALCSALEQLGGSDEIVVQDGGSDDGSQETLRRFAAHDGRVKPVIAPDDGQSDALNRALARAQGEWVVWLNADDVLVDGALDAVRGALGAHPEVSVLTGDHRVLRADGSTVDDYRGRPIETGTLLRRSTCAAFSGSVVARTAYLRELGGFDDALRCAMDYELQFRIAGSRPRQLALRRPIGALRFHDATKTATLWRTFLCESVRLRLRFAAGARQWLLAAVGTAEQVVSFAVFRVRLRPSYRRIRRAFR